MKNGNGGGQQGAGSVLKQLAELETLRTNELKERWRILYGDAALSYNRQFLLKRLAYRIQEIAYGGLPDDARARLNKLLDEEGYDEIAIKVADRSRPHRAPGDRPIPGTMLIREWDGERHEVTALQKGFEYRGIPFRSLSAVARKITGTRWSGPLFFGLRTGPTEVASSEGADGQR